MPPTTSPSLLATVYHIMHACRMWAQLAASSITSSRTVFHICAWLPDHHRLTKCKRPPLLAIVYLGMHACQHSHPSYAQHAASSDVRLFCCCPTCAPNCLSTIFHTLQLTGDLPYLRMYTTACTPIGTRIRGALRMQRAQTPGPCTLVQHLWAALFCRVSETCAAGAAAGRSGAGAGGDAGTGA